jgi:hypothetical protein
MTNEFSSDFEAFPKDDPPKLRRGSDNSILYDSYAEFSSFPFHIKQEALSQNRLKIFKREGDDIETMKSLLGGEDKLADFLYKRDVDDFMNRSRVTNKK